MMVGLEAFDRRRFGHWVAATVLGSVLLASSLLWMSIRTQLRFMYDTDDAFAQSTAAQLEAVRELSGSELSQTIAHIEERTDAVVGRLWAVYYPSLALNRVPSILPYEGGTILWKAVQHIFMPRLIFPNKPELPSDSEMVRRYSGAWVAGANEGTSIAFGYAIESYIDFGVPGMFAPIFLWGVLLGLAYEWFLVNIRHEELATGLTVIVFWLALYLFERSWIKTIGATITMFIYVGGLSIALDRLLLSRARRRELLRQEQESVRRHLSSAQPANAATRVAGATQPDV